MAEDESKRKALWVAANSGGWLSCGPLGDEVAAVAIVAENRAALQSEEYYVIEGAGGIEAQAASSR